MQRPPNTLPIHPTLFLRCCDNGYVPRPETPACVRGAMTGVAHAKDSSTVFPSVSNSEAVTCMSLLAYTCVTNVTRCNYIMTNKVTYIHSFGLVLRLCRKMKLSVSTASLNECDIEKMIPKQSYQKQLNTNSYTRERNEVLCHRTRQRYPPDT